MWDGGSTPLGSSPIPVSVANEDMYNAILLPHGSLFVFVFVFAFVFNIISSPVLSIAEYVVAPVITSVIPFSDQVAGFALSITNNTGQLVHAVGASVGIFMPADKSLGILKPEEMTEDELDMHIEQSRLLEISSLTFNEKAPKADDASTAINATSEERKNAVNMITTLALGKETKVLVELERKLELSLSRSARFLGARQFGAAHAVVNGGFPREALKYLQKGFGTFALSLMFESRLVVNRRNIWGAVGAHTAFNSIGRSTLVSRLLCLAGGLGPAEEISLSLCLLILQKGLEALSNILQNLEDIYLA